MIHSPGTWKKPEDLLIANEDTISVEYQFESGEHAVTNIGPYTFSCMDFLDNSPYCLAYVKACLKIYKDKYDAKKQKMFNLLLKTKYPT